MHKVSSTPKDEAVVMDWLLVNLHEVINDLGAIPLISFNLPHDVVRANASQVKSINTVELTDVQLVSLSYSKLEATISISPNISVDLSWEDYLSSREVRELIGERETEFVFMSLDTRVDIIIKIEFELLKTPPMVASYRVLFARGSSGECTFS